MTAPERIWTASTNGKCHVGFDAPSLNYTNEYVRADLAAVQPAPAPALGAVKVKPLDLSNMLKHAFMCGWYASETISSSSEYNWTEYDPTDNDAYARIMAALEPHPDPRDEVIARLVDAMHTISGDIQINADGEEELSDAAHIARAALAAAKAVKP